jgi:SAM-dependent methyltransferase
MFGRYIKSSKFNHLALLNILESQERPIDPHVDEFHVGGKATTRLLVDRLDIKPGSFILDIGSGLGGAARYIAKDKKCHVLGIDPLKQFTRAAKILAEKSEIRLWDFLRKGPPPTANGEGCVWFKTMNATSNSSAKTLLRVKWDYILIQHVLMHFSSEEKERLSQIISLLLERTKGKLGVLDLVKVESGGQNVLSFPLPFANSDKDQYHLEARKSILEQLKKNLSLIEHKILSPSFNKPSETTKAIMKLVLGPDAALKRKNMQKCIENRQIEVLLAVFGSSK